MELYKKKKCYRIVTEIRNKPVTLKKSVLTIS
nr:MAG TPA: hypothetical protein [Caudoviricetes sp.]